MGLQREHREYRYLLLDLSLSFMPAAFPSRRTVAWLAGDIPITVAGPRRILTGLP
jgi:hypothetical protein